MPNATVPITQDEKWTPDSVWIRFNLKRFPLREVQTEFEQAVHAWMERGIDGEYGDPLHYLDEDFTWYEGDLGMWAECFADLGAPLPETLTAALEALVLAIEEFDLVASIQIGSDYFEEGWPRPPDPEGI